MEDESENLMPSPPPDEAVSPRELCIWICSGMLFSILGFGLFIMILWAARLPNTSPSLFMEPRPNELPDDLPTISQEDLNHKTELDLKTGFILSDIPTIREYVFNITQAYAGPDGFYKPMILVNEQSPGPLIEANNGDTIRVHVNNQMAVANTTIHWHGIDQRNTTWMDGVMGVSQCGIPPGKGFTYEFKIIDQRGTFWYHAHLSVQYTDGLFGPIVIHDPKEIIPKTDDEKILFMGDHYHTYGSTLLESYLKPGSVWSPTEAGVEPLADNFLINGRHTYDCSIVSTTYNESASPGADRPECTGGSLFNTSVRQNDTVRLRLISHSSFMSFWFSIDNHTFSIVEIDGHEVEPIVTRGVYVNIGQRYSIIVTANQTAGNYYMRATLPQTCFTPYCPYISAGLAATGYEAKAILSYEGVDLTAQSTGAPGNTSNPFGIENNYARGDVWEGCDDMPFNMPVPMRKEKAVDVAPENTHSLIFQFRQAGQVNRIFINRTSWSPYTDDAQLWLALDQDFVLGKAGSYNNWNFRLDQQVLLLPAADKGVQIAISSQDIMEHPFHMHGTPPRPLLLVHLTLVTHHLSGHSFQIVGWGPGEFAPGANTTWSLENPMRRDTITVPGQTHVVLRFIANNPGIWALHCHVAWHMEGGMFVTFLERPDHLKSLTAQMDPLTRKMTEGFCEKRSKV